jgi:hypothetical protein
VGPFIRGTEIAQRVVVGGVSVDIIAIIAGG